MGDFRTGAGPEFRVAAGWTVRSHWLCDLKFRERHLAKGQFWEGRTVMEKVLSARLIKPEKEDSVGQRNLGHDLNKLSL